jgi:hypothetical protein
MAGIEGGDPIRSGQRYSPKSTFGDYELWDKGCNEGLSVSNINGMVLDAVLGVEASPSRIVPPVDSDVVNDLVCKARVKGMTSFERLPLPEGISNIHVSLYDATLNVLGTLLTQDPDTTSVNAFRIS